MILIRDTGPAGRLAVTAVAVAGLATIGCGSDSTGGLVTPPPAVTLREVQGRVFSPRCAVSGCHVGTTAPFGLDLGSATSSASNLINVASAEIPTLMRVEPGNPTDSYLYMKVTGDPRILGDQMPAAGELLSASERALIETWIAQGAM